MAARGRPLLGGNRLSWLPGYILIFFQLSSCLPTPVLPHLLGQNLLSFFYDLTPSGFGPSPCLSSLCFHAPSCVFKCCVCADNAYIYLSRPAPSTHQIPLLAWLLAWFSRWHSACLWSQAVISLPFFILHLPVKSVSTATGCQAT